MPAIASLELDGYLSVIEDVSPFVVKQLSALYPRYRFVELDFGSPRVCDALPGNSFDSVWLHHQSLSPFFRAKCSMICRRRTMRRWVR